MVQDVSAPVSIVVVAIEVATTPAAVSASEADTLKRDFEWVLDMLEVIGTPVADAGGLSAVVGFEPSSEMPAAVSQLDSIVCDFAERYPPRKLRALIHIGTAFRARTATGGQCFQGSAVRSATNTLKRSSLPSGIFATPDFASFSNSLKGVFGYEIKKCDTAGFCPVVVAVHRPAASGHELHSTDPELVEWLRARLAKDLGPFASALLDNASHSTRTAKELAAAVGHEIVNPRDRARFDADVFKYIQSRGY